MRKIYIPIILLFFIASSLSAQRLYVRASATGNNTGQSWADAFTDLQSALQIAQPGDTVWVAEGLYRPTGTSNRDISFEPHSGVVVMGGFAGTELSFTQRDWAAHPTVLSGDIGIIGDSTDNSYNVMYLFEPDSATVLDGLIVRDGVADNEAFAMGAYSRLICGGGLYIMGEYADAYPDIRNCVFEHNTALYFGGGVIVNGNNNGSTAPSFWNCRFENNYAAINGGGIAKFGASEVERGIDYDNCKFMSNHAGNWGGGIYYSDGDGRDKIDLLNCDFIKNFSNIKGGGAFFSLGRQTISSFICKGANFSENNSSEGAAIDFFSNFSEFDGDLIVENCVFFQNLSSTTATVGVKSVVYVDLFFTKQSKSIFSDCFFNKNSAARILGVNSSGNGKLLVNKSLFTTNISLQFPVSVLFVSAFEETKISNSTFNNNNRKIIDLATLNIGVICNTLSVNHDTIPRLISFSSINNPLIRSCTILNKTIESIRGSDSKTLNIENSYFEKISINSFSNSGNIVQLSNNYLGGFNCATQPPNVICLDGNITSGDPMFTDTAQGNYTPLPCSPLVHAGNNAFVGLEDSVDLAGNPRIQGGRVDIGAFEAPAPNIAAPPVTTGACAGSAGGAVSFDLAHACPPYQVQWSKDGAVGNGTTHLASGNYNFTITDARGASCTASANIPERDTFQLVPQIVPVHCGDTLGGSASVSIQGAQGPFSFLWSPSNITDSIRSNLAPGSYPLTVTDPFGCTARSIVQVDAIGNLDIEIGVTPISCYEANDGDLLITPLNGKPPFLFEWENGPTSPAYGPLGPGVYRGALTDGFGCRIVWILPLSQPDSLHVEAIVSPATDPIIHNGKIEVSNLSGGTMPYTFAWSNGASGALLENLAPGAYTLTLTDAQGCSKTATYMVPLVVGTSEADRTSSISIWPNPADAQVYIRDMERTGAYHYSIYNALGQVFYQASGAQLDAVVNVRDWPAGMYTCLVQDGTGACWVGRFWVRR